MFSFRLTVVRCVFYKSGNVKPRLYITTFVENTTYDGKTEWKHVLSRIKYAQK